MPRKIVILLPSSAMQKEPVNIVPANESEIVEIQQLATQLNLDLEDTNWTQFVVAKKDRKSVV